MGGLFAAVSREDCVQDLFYGTDYHSHLGTKRGGLAVANATGYTRFIHNISNTQFRSKFEDDLPKLHGDMGLGVISDYEDQPLLIRSHHGSYAIVTVGRVDNLDRLAEKALSKCGFHFAELKEGEINQTELVAALINSGADLVEGIRRVLTEVDGSISLLILTEEAIWAARDRLGRTPLSVGRREGAWAVTMESCALPNLGYESERNLGPGEVVRITADGVERMVAPGERMRVCSFFWIYYGYPASNYEGINVEISRNRCGAALARRDDVEVDLVAGVPDSGVGHALGYASEARLPYRRPFVKYTPTWPRSFMPQDQSVRDLVARMKLIPVHDLIDGQRILFCEDSIVRGTQLTDVIQRLYGHGARELHMRAACPPLLHGCKFLNFSRARSVAELAARRAILEIEGDLEAHLDEYADSSSDRYRAMVERIRARLGLTSLRYQTLDDMIEAIGLPREKACTACWTGEGL